MRPTDLAARRDASTRGKLHRPAEVAKALGCSEWWVKEQARNRRIPYSWIGGSYRFTDDHVAEIVRLFEVRPTGRVSATAPPDPPRPRRAAPQPVESAPRLKARPPRRAARALTQSATAA